MPIPASRYPRTSASDVRTDSRDLATSSPQTAHGTPSYIYRCAVADAATNNVDASLTEKSRVIRVWAVKTAANAGAANTIQVLNGASAITEALNMNVNDTVVVSSAVLNDANWDIAAGGTLRVASVKAGGNAAAIVFVELLKVP